MASELARMLHAEHVQTLSLLDRLEERLSGRRGNVALDPTDAGDYAFLENIISVVENDVDRHFAFEEAVLFPVITDIGAGDLATVLTHDHASISPMAKRLSEMAKSMLEGDETSASWDSFQSVANDLIPQVTFHIQKEEMSVIQRLGSLIDKDMDERLAARYAAINV